MDRAKLGKNHVNPGAYKGKLKGKVKARRTELGLPLGLCVVQSAQPVL
jgi:hypothetical protein